MNQQPSLDQSLISQEEGKFIEKHARAIADSLREQKLDSAQASLALTMALAFIFKGAFEPNGVTVYEASEHVKYNFIEMANAIQKVTIQ